MICRTGQICIVQSPTMNFIFNFKLELYSFCEPCPYICEITNECGYVIFINNAVFLHIIS